MIAKRFLEKLNCMVISNWKGVNFIRIQIVFEFFFMSLKSCKTERKYKYK